MATVEPIELGVRDEAIHCSGCESRIQRALDRLPGVSQVRADQQTQKVSFHGHRSSGAFVLTLSSTVVMYTSIYIWMSELLYFLSLAGLVVAAIWGFFLARGIHAFPGR